MRLRRRKQTSVIRVDHLRRLPVVNPNSKIPQTFGRYLKFIVPVGLLVSIILFALFPLSFTTFVKTVLLSTFFCYIPTAAYRLTKSSSALVRLAVEAMFFLSFILISSFFILDNKLLDTWGIYAFGIILATQLGGFGVEQYAEKAFSAADKSLQEIVEVISGESKIDIVVETIEFENFSYLCIPIGAIIGVILGLARGVEEPLILVLCLKSILLLSSIVLASLILKSSFRMCNPIFKVTGINNVDTEENFFASIFKTLFLIPQANRSGLEIRQQSIENLSLKLAGTTARIRSIYLYNSLHNGILLAAFLPVGLSLFEIGENWNRAIFILIALGIFSLFDYLPYAIGQHLSNKDISDLLVENNMYKSHSSEIIEFKKRLSKWAPVFPSYGTVSLTLSSSFSAVITFLIETLLKPISG